MQIMQFAIGLVILFPLFAGFVWFIWRRYPGAQRIFSFNQARPVLSCFLWAFFGGLSIIVFLSIIETRRVSDIPWVAHGLLAIYFLLSCNAALVGSYGKPARP